MAGPSSRSVSRASSISSSTSRPPDGRPTASRSFIRVVSGGLPALAHLAQALAVGDAHVGEEHLVEVGAARHLLDRPHFHARRLHRQEEHGQALVLGHVGIGAGDDDAVVGVMRARGPDLLAVDHPAVAVTLGPGADAGHVGARRRLGEELAPDFLAVQRGLDVALQVLGRGIGHHGGDAHAQPDIEEASGTR